MSDFDLLEELKNEPKAAPDGLVLEFTIEKSVFDKALTDVAPAVPTRDILPVLKNFHLRVLNGVLRVTGTDTDVTLISDVTVLTTKQEGVCVVPLGRIQSLVKEASGTEIHVKVTAKQQKYFAQVKSGAAQWTMPLSMAAETYPDFTSVLEIGTVEIQAQPFLKVLNHVRKAASTDPMRPYYMLVDVSDNRVRAADGSRFQQVKHAFPFDCQIPIRAAAMIASRIRSDIETIEVGQTNTALIFRFEALRMLVQKSNAQFPDVDETLLLPTLSNDQPLKVHRLGLLGAVKRMRVMADENTAAIVLSLNKGSVSVQCKDKKGGTAVESVPATWELSPRHITFNHAHLSDMLSSTQAETCSFRLGKDLLTKPSPLLLEDADAGLTAVLSQIRLDWI